MRITFRFPDNKKCPRCGYQMPFLRFLWHWRHKRAWNCPWCDAILKNGGPDVAFYAFVAFLVFFVGGLVLMGEHWLVTLSVFFMAGLMLEWSQSVALAKWTPIDETRMNGAEQPESQRLLRIRSGLFRLSRTVILAYVVLTLFLFVFQKNLIYHPIRDMQATPKSEGLAYRDVWLTTSDGVKVHGWFVPTDNEPRATVLFCHGNAGNMSHRLSTLRILHRLHVNAFIFDYRGYGDSEGSPDERGTYRDARAAWDYLTRTLELPPETIILHGRSLGGAVAAELATRHNARGLILESTFTSVPDMGAGMFPIFPVRLICRHRYETLRKLNHIECRVLVVHSPDDKLIPFRHGQKLHETASSSDFLKITGGHNEGFLLSGRAYVDGLDRFVDRALHAAVY